MKRYASLVLTVLIAVLALFSAGCDPRGNLKEEETQKLYDEFKELAESGDLWQRKAHLWLDRDWKSEEEELETVEFMKTVVEKALSDGTEKTINGSWFSSKKYCSIVNITMEGAVRPGDEREGMRSEVIAAKYSDGKWVIFVEDIEPDSDTWNIVVEIEFH